MAKEIKLEAQTRKEENGQAKKIRAKGFIPAVLYGSGALNKKLKVNKIDFERIYSLAGESNLVDLKINNESPVKILVKDIQRDTVKDDIIHIDFYQVDMNKKITTEIPFNFVGESQAVKELNGILVKSMDSVEVECLPSDLVNQIEIDISSLETFTDVVKLQDLKLPSGIKLVSETNDVVINAVPPRIEEEPEVEKEGEEGEEEEGKEKEGEDKADTKKEGEAEGEAKQEKKEDASGEKKEDKK